MKRIHCQGYFYDLEDDVLMDVEVTGGAVMWDLAISTYKVTSYDEAKEKFMKEYKSFGPNLMVYNFTVKNFPGRNHTKPVSWDDINSK